MRSLHYSCSTTGFYICCNNFLMPALPPSPATLPLPPRLLLGEVWGGARSCVTGVKHESWFVCVRVAVCCSKGVRDVCVAVCCGAEVCACAVCCSVMKCVAARMVVRMCGVCCSMEVRACCVLQCVAARKFVHVHA